jgi:ABC-type multidrug transport system fused ATPase/permease subunit
MDKVDLELTQSLGQAFSTLFSVLGAVGAIIAATKGTFLVPLIPLGYVYYLIQKWFRKTSTELQRVTSILNSPIFADFSQILSGTSTVRAYGEEKRFFKQCQSSFDSMNAAYLLVQLTNYWLGLRLDFLGGFIHWCGRRCNVLGKLYSGRMVGIGVIVLDRNDWLSQIWCPHISNCGGSNELCRPNPILYEQYRARST